MSASASSKVIIAALIGNAAISTIKFIVAFMTGSSAMLSEVISSIRAIAESFDDVEKVNELLTMHMGPEFILVTRSIRFRRGQLTRQIEEVIQEIDAAIKAEHGLVKVCLLRLSRLNFLLL